MHAAAPRVGLRRGHGRGRTGNALAGRAGRFVKAELKRADLTYAELAERLKQHGLPNET